MTDDPPRPDPDQLLAQVQRAESRAKRGRLKIFLGYAAGVGKTYAMLRAAQSKREAGIDVVAGYVEAHGRAETDALLSGIEIVPRRRIEHGGVTLTEMDLDAVLKRAPKLALVDELAHTNAPRSRHAKRWQDVVEILDAGIDVYTTLNVQHLESLNDVVAQITGVVVRETLPDKVLDEASEIELIDLPIVELLERLAAGKVYSPEAARRAATSFFREGNLFALRELALRRAADRVDEQVKDYLESHAIAGPSAARERVLVCVSASPLSERLVRSARRLAQSLDAEWHAVYVETPADARLPRAGRDRIAATLRFAEELGARARSIPGQSVADALASYARAQHVTKIVIGKPLRSRIAEWLRGSVVDGIVRASGVIDVYVISSAEESESTADNRSVPEPALDVWDLTWGLLLVAAATGIGLLLRSFIAPTNLAMLFLLVVVFTSLRCRRRTAIVIAISSVVAFDFFLVPPYLTFVVADTQYVITFVAMIVVALVTSGLEAHVRSQSEAAMRREAQTAALYECSRALGQAADVDAVVAALVEQVGATFHENVAVWLPAPGGIELHDASAPFPTQVFERGVAQWVYEHARPAGRGTDTLSGVRSLHVPMRSGEIVRGVVSLFRADDATDIPFDDRRLLESFASQAAAALERLQLADARSQTQLLEERERIKTALLDSVSHDLRTPLASITGALSSLRDDGQLLDEPAKAELIETAATEATRLNRLLGDLLDMTRLQAGGVLLRRQPCDLLDLVGVALEQLSSEIRDRKVDVHVAPDMPLVPLDFTLACQALTNVIGNAHRYSPADAAIEVTARVAGESAVIEVSDRGVGIPASELERVFEKFHRVTGASREGGSGLGLSISKAIATAHGGSVHAEHREGGGTIVTLRFPLSMASESPAGSVP